MGQETNEDRIAKGQGWVQLGKSIDSKYIVQMLREKIDIWHPKKDKILRVIEIEQDEKKSTKESSDPAI